jgi:hypothetical protein
MPPSLKVWVKYTYAGPFTINLYGKLTFVDFPITLQYSTDGGTNWEDAGSSFNSTSCDLRASIDVTAGTGVIVRGWDGASAWPISRALDSTTCPAAGTGCLAAISTRYSGSGTSRNVAVTVDVLGTVCP